MFNPIHSIIKDNSFISSYLLNFFPVKKHETPVPPISPHCFLPDGRLLTMHVC